MSLLCHVNVDSTKIKQYVSEMMEKLNETEMVTIKIVTFDDTAAEAVDPNVDDDVDVDVDALANKVSDLEVDNESENITETDTTDSDYTFPELITPKELVICSIEIPYILVKQSLPNVNETMTLMDDNNLTFVIYFIGVNGILINRKW